MKQINKFETWFNKINEDLGQDSSATISTADQPQQATQDAPARDNMINDIDIIMNSLETLAGELTEELKEELDVNEAGVLKNAAWSIKAWIISLKAVKMQRKVNKIKMNAASLEFASIKLDGDKKKKAIEKSKLVNIQGVELQKMVNDKFADKGSVVDSKLSREKIAGQMELIKFTSGMEQDPNKASDLKSKLAELNKRFAEEDKSIKAMEDENADAIAQQQKGKKSGDSDTNTDGDTDAQQQKGKKSGDSDTSTDGDTDTGAQQQKGKKSGDSDTSTDGDTDTNTDGDTDTNTGDTNTATGNEELVKKLEATVTSAEKAKENLGSDATDEDTAKAEVTLLTAQIALAKAKEEDTKDLEAKLAAAKAPNESLVIRANSLGLNELATDIESKSDWQIAEGTVLFNKYNTIIRKQESDKILNESKHQISSIKDAFSRLM